MSLYAHSLPSGTDWSRGFTYFVLWCLLAGTCFQCLLKEIEVSVVRCGIGIVCMDVW
jgi:hypothetical protein